METSHKLLGKLLLEFEDAVWWLTDERCIVLGYDGGGFPPYFEHCWFKPGTPKNAEFEVLVAPVVVNGVHGLAGFYRIMDTVEKRVAFSAAGCVGFVIVLYLP